MRSIFTAICGLAGFGLIGCAEKIGAPEVTAETGEVTWRNPTGSVSTSALLLVPRTNGGGLRDITLGAWAEETGRLRQFQVDLLVDSGVRVAALEGIEEELNPYDPYFESNPIELAPASIVAWDNSNAEFDFEVRQTGGCEILVSDSEVRTPGQAFRINARCAMAATEGTWTHSAETIRTVTLNQASVRVEERVEGNGNYTFKKALASAGIVPGAIRTCAAASLLSEHQAALLYEGTVSLASPIKSSGTDDGCVDPPVGCGGGLDEVRVGQVPAPWQLRLRGSSRNAGLEDEVEYPVPNCTPGGGGTSPGRWRCFTTTYYWLETGIVLRVERWCLYEAASLVDEKSTEPAGSSNARSVTLVVKSSEADSSVQVVLFGDEDVSDEIVIGGGALGAEALAGALRVYEEIRDRHGNAKPSPGESARVRLGFPYGGVPGRDRHLPAAREAIERLRSAPPESDESYGAVRRVMVIQTLR